VPNREKKNDKAQEEEEEINCMIRGAKTKTKKQVCAAKYARQWPLVLFLLFWELFCFFVFLYPSIDPDFVQ
jgi:hypothetical protein